MEIHIIISTSHKNFQITLVEITSLVFTVYDE